MTAILTAHSSSPSELRRKAIDHIRRAVAADMGFFYTLYELDGERYMSDALIAGPGASDAPVADVINRPAPTGSAGSPLAGEGWRKGRWDVHMPLRSQRGRFISLDQDLDRAAFRETPVWAGFYEPAGIEDHIRALVYDGTCFAGWIGVFRQGARFSDDDRRALESCQSSITALVLSAHRMAAAQLGEVAAYAMFDASGRCCHATKEARAFFSDERQAWLASLVRQLDRRGADGPSAVFCDGVRFHLVRLDGSDGVRYLVVLDRGAFPRLSPLARLTNRQRMVVERAATGATVAEIAARLRVSVNTVKNHLKEAYRVLEVSSRAELAQLWARWS